MVEAEVRHRDWVLVGGQRAPPHQLGGQCFIVLATGKASTEPSVSSE